MPFEYTLIDAGKMAVALGLLPLILVLPGYTFARWLGLASFSRRPTWQRLLLGLLFSVGIMPIAAYLGGRVAGMPGAMMVTLAGCGTSVVFLFRDGIRHRRYPWKYFAIFCVIWATILFFSTVDLQIGHHVYPGVVSYDLCFRSILTEQFAQFPEVPGNALFFDGQPSGLRYHYFWFLYCGLLERVSLGWLPARLILSASSIWLAVAIGWLLVLFVRYFQPARTKKGKRSSIALALTLVNGLDVLAVGTLCALGLMKRPPPTLEWWNPQQITGWVDQFLWIPNHVAGLVACLLAILMLATDVVRPARRTAAAFVAGLCLSAAAGLSIYVAFTAVVFLVIWGLSLALRRDWRRFAALTVCGSVLILTSLPYLLELLAASGEGSRGSQFATIAIRPFQLWHITALAIFPELSRLWLGAGDVVLLPFQYFLELGFFFFALLWGLKGKNRQASAAVQIAWTGLAVGTLLRSVAAHGNNDLGWRCFMPAQFVMLLWGAEMIATTKVRRLVILILGIGLLGTVTEVGWQRVALPWVEASVSANPKLAAETNRTNAWLTEIRGFGERTYDARRAYDWINQTVPSGGRIQHTPRKASDLFHGLYSQRTALLDGTLSSEGVGIAPARVAAMGARIEAVMTSPSSANWETGCATIPAAAWVVKDTDPAWNDRESWLWHRPASFRNRHFAVFLCQH